MSLVPEGTEGARPVLVWSLAMDSPTLLRSAAPVDGAQVREIVAGKAEVSARLYREVGAPWHWVDRAEWSPEQWSVWTDRPEHRLLVIEDGGALAGYLELEGQGEGAVEIAYFGLLPGYAGRGLGGLLLSEGLRAAWAQPGTSRVWVHTCELDAPAALANYRARGMEVFATATEHRLAPGP